jgi:hypothetical protein
LACVKRLKVPKREEPVAKNTTELGGSCIAANGGSLDNARSSLVPAPGGTIWLKCKDNFSRSAAERRPLLPQLASIEFLPASPDMTSAPASPSRPQDFAPWSDESAQAPHWRLWAMLQA